MDEHRAKFQPEAMVLSQLSIGDLVEINRGTYCHWAVYVGDGMVAHVTGSSEAMLGCSSAKGTFNPFSTEQVQVKIETVMKAAKG